MLCIRWAANAARPVAIHTFPTFQREIVCQKSLLVPQLGPGSMTLVFSDALHPLGGQCRPARGYRRSPRVSLASKWIRTHQKYPVRLSWGGCGRKFRSKPGGFVTRQAPSLLKQGAYTSAAQGMQEQTRRVCDAAPAINANAESIRKRSAGYAMLFKSVLPQVSHHPTPAISLMASPARIMPMTGGTKERLPGRCRPFSTITSLVSMGGSVE